MQLRSSVPSPMSRTPSFDPRPDDSKLDGTELDGTELDETQLGETQLDESGLEDTQPDEPGDITQLVSSFSEGDRDAFDRLMPLVYRDLRLMARRQLRRAARGQTLDTTGLVHELYLKMSKQKGLVAQNREHFLSIAARAMRQVVVTHLRRRSAAKRGQAEAHTTLHDHHVPDRAMENVLDVDSALARLGQRRPRLEQVVECRFFGGLSEEETAEALGISVRTVQRDWMRARLWLQEALGESEPS